MLLISPESHDPYFNLALEEVLLKNTTGEYLLLWINDPCVVVGKHQVAHMEADTRYVTEHFIPVVRRISGGGTVYHDRGNLNFSFIRNSEEGKQVDFRRHTLPVIGFLESLSLDARFEGKNDIRIDGLKISGNAEHVHRKRVLHHGTLLVNSSIGNLRNSIRSDKSCYESRAVNSNPAPVINISERLPGKYDAYSFREEMIRYFLSGPEKIIFSEPAPEITNAAAGLANSKYRSWEWNYAYGPDYVLRKSSAADPFKGGFSLYVHNGLISGFDTAGNDQMKSIEEKAIGVRHMVDDLQNLFSEEKIMPEGSGIFNFF